MEVGRLEDETRIRRCLDFGKEGQGDEHLGEVINLEVRVWASITLALGHSVIKQFHTQPIHRFIVLSDTFASITDELKSGMSPGSHSIPVIDTHRINLFLVFQLSRNFFGPLQILEVTLHEMDPARIPVLLELLHRLCCMFFLLRYKYDL